MMVHPTLSQPFLVTFFMEKSRMYFRFVLGFSLCFSTFLKTFLSKFKSRVGLRYVSE